MSKKRGISIRPTYVQIVWQMDHVGAQMMSYLSELKGRYLKANPNVDSKQVITRKLKSQLDPVIYIKEKSYTVHSLPAELVGLMGSPWTEGYVRSESAFRKGKNRGKGKNSKDAAGPSGSQIPKPTGDSDRPGSIKRKNPDNVNKNSKRRTVSLVSNDEHANAD